MAVWLKLPICKNEKTTNEFVFFTLLLKTKKKNEIGTRFSFARLKKKNEKGNRYPFFFLKFEKEKGRDGTYTDRKALDVYRTTSADP